MSLVHRYSLKLFWSTDFNEDTKDFIDIPNGNSWYKKKLSKDKSFEREKNLYRAIIKLLAMTDILAGCKLFLENIVFRKFSLKV